MNARDSSNRLSELLRREHHAMAAVLVALAGFDAKRLWLELGYPSLFTYLNRELGLSKSAAFYRKTAAELIQRFPELVEPLEDGKLCLSTVGELAQVLTPENRDQVIPRFLHLSKQEARAVVAELKPVERPPRREVMTTVRVAAAAPPVRDPEPAAVLELGAPATACVIAPGSPAELVDAKVATRTVNAPISRTTPPTWALENGGVCGSRHRLQYDHIQPKALGGKSTIENVRLLCARHNLLAARKIFGDAWMDRYAPARKATAATGRRDAGSAGARSEVPAAALTGPP
ncbi:HNH endonuclease [Anaeromyxobacter oryzae]|uniref:HNH nuclease domain-containing protein n=1 Tax=Anaeromyxobacter oryzae TaxID=2918170 RepID=A0ABM7WUD7_9BACT|nr:HNH endonuclease signature motif containing protein [Anaeromyxobacter oryzae]BDG03095.1 hypothetical protein AMOR_20910 [Anaeromyxobacter oryzae]